MMALVNPALLIFPSIAVVLIFIFMAARRAARQSLAMLREFAAARGLQTTEESALGFTTVRSMEGVQAGRRVRYWTYTTGSGKSRVTWAAVSVEPRADGGLQFEITPQHFGSKVLEFFGVKEIQVGDPVFDAAWFVRTNQPEFLAAALVPSIREQLMSLSSVTRGGRYQLEAGRVRYAEKGTLGQTATLARLEAQVPVLQALADVAEVAAEGR